MIAAVTYLNAPDLGFSLQWHLVDALMQVNRVAIPDLVCVKHAKDLQRVASSANTEIAASAGTC
eukprot:5367360-Amphidinium_carterae.1